MLSDTNDAPQYPPLILPPSSRQALLSTHLLEIGLESAEIVTGAIIKRICWKEPEISRTLCKMVESTLTNISTILGSSSIKIYSGRVDLESCGKSLPWSFTSLWAP